MSINKNSVFKILATGIFAFIVPYSTVFSNTAFAASTTSLVSKVSANVILFESPSMDSSTITFVLHNDFVKVIDIENTWAKVQYNKSVGYISTEYLSDVSNSIETQTVEPEKTKDDTLTIVKKTDTKEIALENNISKTIIDDIRSSIVEFTEWTIAKNIFTIGVPAKIYDIYTGKVYYVKSFSNGNHADVEPITKEDTSIMKSTFDGVWSWDVRPVLVTINGKTMAASINGMPHAVGVNDLNGMDGQICIHFKGSKTHNGNVSYTNLHQQVALEAYNLTKNK